jgi:hypothetical protein
MWLRLTLKEGNRPIWIWRSYQQDVAVRRSEANDATIITIGCGAFAVIETLPTALRLLGMKDPSVS